VGLRCSSCVHGFEGHNKDCGFVSLSGVLLIPLWRSARFWCFTFPDGRHLASVFCSMEVVPITTLHWDILTKHDAIGGKLVRFFALGISSFGDSVIESKVGPGRCMHLCFGKPCNCSND
jgi:hypothetical protein